MSFASNHEPMFLADDTGVIAELPTQRLEIITLASCWDVPMIRDSVLSSFSFNLSILYLSFNIQLRISSIQLSILAKATSWLTLALGQKDK